MKTLTARLIAKFTADAAYRWEEYHAAKADSLPLTAARHLAAYNRLMAAIKRLTDRIK